MALIITPCTIFNTPKYPHVFRISFQATRLHYHVCPILGHQNTLRVWFGRSKISAIINETILGLFLVIRLILWFGLRRLLLLFGFLLLLLDELLISNVLSFIFGEIVPP